MFLGDKSALKNSGMLSGADDFGKNCSLGVDGGALGAKRPTVRNLKLQMPRRAGVQPWVSGKIWQVWLFLKARFLEGFEGLD